MNTWIPHAGIGAPSLPYPVPANITGGIPRRVAADIPPTFLPPDPLLEIKKAEVVAVDFRTPAPAHFGAHVRVGNSTVGEVVKQYAEAYWRFRRSPWEAQRHASIRAVAVNRLGRTTPYGITLGEVLTAVGKFVTELAAARRVSLRDYPNDRILVDEVAAEVLNRGIVAFSDRRSVDNPTGTLNYYIQPRVAARLEKIANEKAAEQSRLAAEATRKQAEEQVRQQIAAIRYFCAEDYPASAAGFKYALSGRVIFVDIEEMEKNCPAGRYQRLFPQAHESQQGRHVLAYDGNAVVDVFLEQPTGAPRRVSFRGESWIYDDQEPMEDHDPRLPMPASANRHFNAWWNNDPRVVKERAAASAEGRDILG